MIRNRFRKFVKLTLAFSAQLVFFMGCQRAEFSLKHFASIVSLTLHAIAKPVQDDAPFLSEHPVDPELKSFVSEILRASGKMQAAPREKAEAILSALWAVWREPVIPHVVIAVDQSASMGIADERGGQTRYEAAIALTDQWKPELDRWQACGQLTWEMVGFSVDGGIRRITEAQQPGGETNLAEFISQSSHGLERQKHPHIITTFVLTDCAADVFQLRQRSPLSQRFDAIHLVPFGNRPAPNVALIELRVPDRLIPGQGVNLEARLLTESPLEFRSAVEFELIYRDNASDELKTVKRDSSLESCDPVESGSIATFSAQIPIPKTAQGFGLLRAKARPISGEVMLADNTQHRTLPIDRQALTPEDDVELPLLVDGKGNVFPWRIDVSHSRSHDEWVARVVPVDAWPNLEGEIRMTLRHPDGREEALPVLHGLNVREARWALDNLQPGYYELIVESSQFEKVVYPCYHETADFELSSPLDPQRCAELSGNPGIVTVTRPEDCLGRIEAILGPVVSKDQAEAQRILESPFRTGLRMKPMLASALQAAGLSSRTPSADSLLVDVSDGESMFQLDLAGLAERDKKRAATQVFLIDASPSMRDGAPVVASFQRAIEVVAKGIDFEPGAGHRKILLVGPKSFADNVLMPLLEEGGRLDREGIEIEVFATVSEALNSVAELKQQTFADVKVSVVSNFRASFLSQLQAESERLRGLADAGCIEAVGIPATETANYCIRDLEILPPDDDETEDRRLRWRAKIVNDSSEVLDSAVQVIIDRRPIDQVVISKVLPGDECVVEGKLPADIRQTEVLQVQLESLDSQPIDNVRWCKIPSRRSVLLITNGDGPLAESPDDAFVIAVEAISRSSADRLWPMQVTAIGKADFCRERLSSSDGLILYKLDELTPEISDAVNHFMGKGGRVLVVPATGLQLEWLKPILDSSVPSHSAEHQAQGPDNLAKLRQALVKTDIETAELNDLVDSTKAKTLKLVPVLESGEKPIVLHSSDEARRLAILTTTFEKSSFQHQVGFVILVSGLMEYLTTPDSAELFLEGDLIAANRQLSNGYLDSIELPDGQNTAWARDPRNRAEAKVSWIARLPGVYRGYSSGDPLKGSDGIWIVNPRVVESHGWTRDNRAWACMLNALRIPIRLAHE